MRSDNQKQFTYVNVTIATYEMTIKNNFLMWMINYEFVFLNSWNISTQIQKQPLFEKHSTYTNINTNKCLSNIVQNNFTWSHNKSRSNPWIKCLYSCHKSRRNPWKLSFKIMIKIFGEYYKNSPHVFHIHIYI